MQAPRNATAPKRIVIPAIKQAAPPVLRVCFGLRIVRHRESGLLPESDSDSISVHLGLRQGPPSRPSPIRLRQTHTPEGD
jgi:hypothetical protein